MCEPHRQGHGFDEGAALVAPKGHAEGAAWVVGGGGAVVPQPRRAATVNGCA